MWGHDVSLVEEVRIGRLNGPEEYVFGSIADLTVDAEGRIYVADGQVPIVRVYDADGRFVRNLGRRGAGPGEFRWISGVRMTPGGDLAVWDPGNGRITLFEAGGDSVSSIRVVTALYGRRHFEVDRAGRFYVYVTMRSLPDGLNGWARLSAAGEAIDTLRLPASLTDGRSYVLATPSGYDRPFPLDSIGVPWPRGGLITGFNGEYAFRLERSDGSAIRIEREYSPVSIERAERAEWGAITDHFDRVAPVLGAEAPVATIPDVKPAYKDLFAGADGRIWVHRYVEAMRRPERDRAADRPESGSRPRRVWWEQPTFDVFEPDGTYLGTVEVPHQARIYHARGRFVWATFRGEFDEPYVVRYRIQPGREGG